MLLITAPSKSQRRLSKNYPAYTLPYFEQESSHLISYLKRLSQDELCSLMNMSAKLGKLTAERIAAFQPPFTPDNSSQALFTFDGDVFTALTSDKYTKKELATAQEQLRILSGLYGLLRPLDLIFPYRLEMATRLVTDRGKNLYEFWGNQITDRINEDLQDHEDPTLVDLASAEYVKAVVRKQLKSRLLRVVFKEHTSGSYKTIAIYAKRARGMMIHYVIKNNLTQSEDLKDFSSGGYIYNSTLSTPDTYVFTRE